MSEQQQAKREYSGGALNTFVLGLKDSPAIVEKVLAEVGLERIDPEAWYDFEVAERVMLTAQKLAGQAVMRQIGKTMVESAEYPPEIDSVGTLLPALPHWYALHARGPDVGTITCEMEDEHSATLDWATGRFPCAFCMGILEGACTRFGVKPLIEHGAGSCKDHGDRTCIYHVSW